MAVYKLDYNNYYY